VTATALTFGTPQKKSTVGATARKTMNSAICQINSGWRANGVQSRPVGSRASVMAVGRKVCAEKAAGWYAPVKVREKTAMNAKATAAPMAAAMPPEWKRTPVFRRPDVTAQPAMQAATARILGGESRSVPRSQFHSRTSAGATYWITTAVGALVK